MKKWKRYFSVFLALIMLVGLLPPVNVTAVSAPQKLSSGVYEPYAHIVLQQSDADEILSVNDTQYASEDDAALIIRQQMITRQDSIQVKMRSTNPDHEDAVADLVEKVFAHTGNPKEGDSLRWQYSGYQCAVSYQVVSGVYYYSLTFTFEYFTTAQQEAELDAKVAEVLASLDLEGKNDYQKVKAIYDWLCTNVTYDYDNLHDHKYMLKHSTYAAMIHKTAVCQGYALAFYRMALELGIDSRYISGMSGSDRHAWNIVELDYLYYNLDPTWDAESTTYSYFLTSDANFPYHIRDEKFTTAEFYAAYPMSATNYTPSVPPDLGDQSGSAGTGISWKLSADGVLTISGNGSMDNYVDGSKTPWASIREYIREVVVKEGITAVGDNAFGGSRNLVKVTLPEGMTSIGWDAFSNCGSLRSIHIPSTVSYIGAYAFQNCTGLPAITIPAGVTNLGWGAFRGCSSLTQIQVEQGNAAYCDVDGVLYSKDGKTLHTYPAGRTDTSFSAPSGVETLYFHAFDSTVHLQELTLPKGLLTIQGAVFQNCQALTEITLPGSLTFIGASAFYLCRNLAHIYYWGTAQMWNEVEKGDYWDESTGAYQLHFLGVDQRQGTIRVESVTVTAGRLATVNIYIENNPGLNYLELEIDFDRANLNQEAVNNGTVLPLQQYAVTYVWGQQLDSTENGRLISLKLRVLDSAPEGAYTITPVVSLARNENGESVDFEVIGGTVKVENQTSEGEGQLEYTLSEDGRSYTVASIGSWVGQELVIPATYNGLPVTAIGYKAFSGDADLTAVTLPEGMTTIGRYAFDRCSNLRRIDLPSTVTSIGDYAFGRCAALTDISLPAAVTSVGWGAFVECTSLTAITVAPENQYYDSVDGVLYRQGGETLAAYPGGKTDAVFYVPAGVQILDVHSFDSCNHLTKVILPDGLQKIGNAAFQLCENLVSITMPQSLTSIGDSAFNYCRSLAYIYYAGTPEMWSQITKKSDWDKDTGAYRIIYPGERKGDIIIGSGAGTNGEIVTVTISLQENPGVAHLELALSYDHSALTLLSATNGTVLNSLTGGDTLVWMQDQDSAENGTLVTLQFKIAQTAAAGAYPVAAVVNAARNGASEDISFQVTAGAVTVETVIVDASEGLEYTLNTEGTGYIVTGIGECADADLVIPAVHNGLPVVAIGQSAFYYCKTLRSVTLPEGLTTIEFNAFGLCINLQSIHFPSTLQTIDYNVFSRCKSLTSVTIPAGLTYLGGGAFSGCAALAAIEVEEGSLCYKDIDGVVYTGDGKTLMAYPCGRANASFIVPAGVERLFEYSFDGADNLTEVILPDGLERIDDVVFQSCDNLAAVTIPATVAYIGSSAFSSCRKLTDIYYLGTQEMWDAMEKHETWDYQIGDYTLHVQEQVQNYVYGDADGNGVINGKDIILLRKFMANLDYDTGISTVTVSDGADVNGDGQINGNDLILLRRYIANYDYDTGISTVPLGPQ